MSNESASPGVEAIKFPRFFSIISFNEWEEPENVEPFFMCIVLPVCDAGVWAFGVLPVRPFDWEPPGGSSNLTTKEWKQGLQTDMMLLWYTTFRLLRDKHLSVYLHCSLMNRAAEMLMVSSTGLLMDTQRLLSHMIKLHMTADMKQYIPRCLAFV